MATPVFLFPDIELLLSRAERCRSLASTFSDPVLRDGMLEIASGYDKLAKDAEALTPLQSIRVSKLDT